MKIYKSNNIRIKLTWLAIIGITFLCFFTCFLAWGFNIRVLLICLCIVIGLAVSLLLICLLLNKLEKQYYLIDEEGIKLYKKDRLIFIIKKADIVEMNYIRFGWAFLLQMGSGYLNITYMCDNQKDKKFSMIYPTGEAIHSVSMSLQQAKNVATLLLKHLNIT